MELKWMVNGTEKRLVGEEQFGIYTDGGWKFESDGAGVPDGMDGADSGRPADGSVLDRARTDIASVTKQELADLVVELGGKVLPAMNKAKLLEMAIDLSGESQK